MTAIPDTCREVRLKTRPDGLPSADNFEIVSVPLPIPADGEALVRNLYFLVSASLRMMISKGAEDVEGVPFPALREGETLAGKRWARSSQHPQAVGSLRVIGSCTFEAGANTRRCPSHSAGL